jgi:hypothetical protein
MSTTQSIEKAIRQAWSRDTCYPLVQNKWSTQRPELGQCAVTALVVQDIFGGDIVYNSKFDHFWNVLPSGRKVDLTKGQFDTRVTGPAVTVERTEILESEDAIKFNTKTRYLLLKKRIESFAD